jgi:D-beta-D-heptose 7-phosphate kinase/D-beta-D-heptose 1-phosphate adenosyltransferase
MIKVFLIGDQIIDQYIFGSCNKISPEAPVVVVEEERREMKKGGASNVSANLEALGAKVVSWYGDKEPSIKTRVVSGHHQIVRIDRDNIEVVPPPKGLEQILLETDIVMISDYDQGVVNEEVMFEINYLAQRHKKRVIVDPYRNKFDYGPVDLIKPNRKELESVVGVKITKETLAGVGRSYLKMSRAKNLIVTLGAEGMALFDHNTYFDKPFICKPKEAKEVIDVTGAGDTVFAVLGFIWAHRNFSKSTSLQYATKAGSIAVSRFGCAVVERGEVFETNDSFHERMF